MADKITNVFVLMMENHSFDHILGYSKIKGKDAITGADTEINGLTGTETNSYNGKDYVVKNDADACMPSDPGHEFLDTKEQLCGQNGTYPAIDNSGFVLNYAASSTEGATPTEGFGDVMRCYDTPVQLPVIYQLANEFAVCDSWFSSLPGPTCPNRFFALGASSGGLDHSPTSEQMLIWQTLRGFKFPNGSIFERLDESSTEEKKLWWRLYNDNKKCIWGGQVPMVAALKEIRHVDIHSIEDFKSDLNDTDWGYPYVFTFIEPNYGDVLNNTFKNGSSQHPMDAAAAGEQLIKDTYEAIRNSPVWNTSVLIITYDEHGGFYDHVKPPAAIPPGDKTDPKNTTYGFDFKQYGVRVPAVIVSPLIPKNTIDHTPYDHTSILKTLSNLYGFAPLTQRDKNANDLIHLFSLENARTDCPKQLRTPATSEEIMEVLTSDEEQNEIDQSPLPDKGTFRNMLQITMQTDLQLSDGTEAAEERIKTIYANLKTRGDAKVYVKAVMQKLDTARAIKKMNANS